MRTDAKSGKTAATGQKKLHTPCWASSNGRKLIYTKMMRWRQATTHGDTSDRLDSETIVGVRSVPGPKAKRCTRANRGGVVPSLACGATGPPNSTFSATGWTLKVRCAVVPAVRREPKKGGPQHPCTAAGPAQGEWRQQHSPDMSRWRGEGSGEWVVEA